MALVGTFELRGPGGEPVDFRRLLASHGVATLAPNAIDLDAWVFQTTVAVDGGAHSLRVAEARPGVAQVESSTLRGARQKERVLGVVRHLLRLEEDLSGFYARAASDTALSWVTSGAGRMLRSQTVFEDVVKTICTTNTSWSATVRMTDGIVSGLGLAAPDGRHAFPSPATMAAAPDSFYAEVARAGYRGAYLRRLATDVAEGRLDLEELADPAISDLEVEQRLLALPGVGPYAAAHVMLTSLGRYGRLVLDSWTRPKYAQLTGRRSADKTIQRRFRPYGEYAGLAFWMLLTEDWVED
ncbi:MAG: DNA-3-methyladenine glycosylase 2 family protein [Solirubrobacterales bacterium]|nr:DNA-3-methyladenine glycosylase 2 family protein [Solirubrobacterales bacterium]